MHDFCECEIDPRLDRILPLLQYLGCSITSRTPELYRGAPQTIPQKRAAVNNPASRRGESIMEKISCPI